MTYIILADVESLIKKIDGCKKNSIKSSTTKMEEHIPCGYSMSAIWAFDGIGDMHNVCRAKDSMKKFS